MDHPYPITKSRAALSPMKTVLKVKATLARYAKGESIGFTLRSSLKSMGLIPRSDGVYRLGNKYKE